MTRCTKVQLLASHGATDDRPALRQRFAPDGMSPAAGERCHVGYDRITTCGGKGAKDRVTNAAGESGAALEHHSLKVRLQFEEDQEAGFGGVYRPNALARKYPNAERE